MGAGASREKNEIAVVESVRRAATFGDDHRLSANLASDALGSVDLVIRWLGNLMPNVGELPLQLDAAGFMACIRWRKIRRNWPLDLGLVSRREGRARSSGRRAAEAHASSLDGRIGRGSQEVRRAER